MEIVLADDFGCSRACDIPRFCRLSIWGDLQPGYVAMEDEERRNCANGVIDEEEARGRATGGVEEQARTRGDVDERAGEDSGDKERCLVVAGEEIRS